MVKVPKKSRIMRLSARNSTPSQSAASPRAFASFIRMLGQSHLPAKQTLAQLGIARRTF
jgi:hypothetical protein